MPFSRYAWSAVELHVLLTLLRQHMTEYLYSTDEAFAAFIQPKLRPTRPRNEVTITIRELMQGFGMALSTRIFRKEEITVNNVAIYPYEHLYETMLAQPESRKGGVWHPDDLRLLLDKCRTYREDFDRNHELFFVKTQIWSKSSVDVRAKFYLWRDLYMDDCMKETEIPLTAAERKRKLALHDIFANVPPAPSPLPAPSTPVHTDDSRPVAPSSKHQRMRLWSTKEQEVFTQLLVDVTLEIQNKGHSELLRQLPQKLNRSEAALLGKLQDMRLRYDNKHKAVQLRAANLPAVLYDKSSTAYSIFNANWDDREDPFALGYFAIKELCQRANGRKKRPLPPLRMEMRPRATPERDSPANGSAVTPTPATATSYAGQAQIHPVAKTTTTQTAGESTQRLIPRSEFVRDCALMIEWAEDQTQALCAAMVQHLPLYESDHDKLFCKSVASAVRVKSPFQVLRCIKRIFRLCQERYGALACFAAAVEGSETQSLAVSIEVVNTTTALAEPDASPAIDQDSGVATPVLAPLEKAPAYEQRQRQRQSASIRKSRNIVRHQNSSERRDTTSDSSPSVHPFSPDNYDEEAPLNFDREINDQDDTDVMDEGEQEAEEDAHAEFQNDDAQSLISMNSAASHESSDYGGEHVYHYSRVHPSRMAQPPLHSTPSKVRVAAHKTVVVKHSRPLYYDSPRDRRRKHRRDGHGPSHSRRPHRDAEYASISVHHKQRHYQSYSYTGVSHKITHRAPLTGIDEYASDDAMSEAEVNELNQQWAELLAPIQQSIEDLKAKRCEQEERTKDLAERQRKQQWKLDLRQQLFHEYISGISTPQPRQSSGP